MSFLLHFAGSGGGEAVSPLTQGIDFDTTDWLEMTSANWGAFDREKFAVIARVEPNAFSNEFYLYVKQGELEIKFQTNGALRINTSNPPSGNGQWISDAGVVGAGGAVNVLVHYDRQSATTGERIRAWADGVELTPASYTAPSAAMATGTNPMRLNSSQNGAVHGDGTLYSAAFVSGALPDPADVFTSSGKLKDLSGLSGLYSYLDVDGGDVTSDDTRGTDWTSNGTPTAIEVTQ